MYAFLKIIARLAFPFYCRNIRINNKELLNAEGPLLIACNHPNSFLDAIILATLFKRPVYSLARGDVFKNKVYAGILMALKMFPVYRASEGVENMDHNYSTFDKCKEIFKQNGIVLIFSEGRCINEWRLRPLMKGTARLAISSWQDHIPLRILPTGINYSSFHRFGKNIQLNFGDAFGKETIDLAEVHGKQIAGFNAILKTQLENLVVEIEKHDGQKQQSIFNYPISTFKYILLFIPALIGWLIHLPLFIPVKKFVWKKAAHNDHYDSLMVAVLFATYPLLLLLVSSIAVIITGKLLFFLLLIIVPFTAWAQVQLKKQF